MKIHLIVMFIIFFFLRERGFGGLYGVGKAAEHPPALAVLSHIPTAAKVSKHIPGRWIRIRMDLH